MLAVSSASKDLILALHHLLHVHSAADSPDDGLLQACTAKAYLTVGW